MAYTLIVKDGWQYVPQELHPEAIKVGEDLGLDNETVNIYNSICMGGFNLYNGDGDMFFNPKSEGIGYFHDRNWTKKKLAPLVKAGLVTFESNVAPRDKRYRIYFWYSSKTKLTSNFLENSRKYRPLIVNRPNRTMISRTILTNVTFCKD